MEQFSLEKYLENTSRKLVTGDGRPVRIICIDRKARSGNIVGLVGKDESLIYVWNNDGKYIVSEIPENDLFFADEEEKPQSIEIPFGAFDSEFVKDEYLIPEGCEARIEGNKVIIEKIQEEELTKFEKGIINIVFKYKYWDSNKDEVKQHIKKDSNKLLDLARKKFRKEQQEKLGTLEMPIDVTEPYYIKGKQDALKDLPKWKKAKKDEELDCHVAIQQNNRVVLSDFVQKDEYYITLDVLKKLPKEE